MRGENSWQPISDMMAGLMMVFMLLAITFMLQTEYEKAAMAEVAETYEETKFELTAALREEFSADLARWGAEILPDTTIRFRNPEILFALNSAELTASFRSILDDFFPRYLAILQRDLFKDEILEVRIEGHTSSGWTGAVDKTDAYLRNMDLSQLRSSAVLRYVYQLNRVDRARNWLSGVLRANGLSSSQPLLDTQNHEDAAGSRRVEFRVLTRTEERILTILERARS